MTESTQSTETLEPSDYWKGLRQFWKQDILSGFVVFLIALPLCIGISIASGAPPTAGLLAGIVGGILASLLSGSHLTINGPAAGLIVIVLHSIEVLGGGDPMQGFRYTLAAILLAGLLQIILSLARAGLLSVFFPSTVIHGMMAAIGLIIISKQIHTALGVKPEANEILELISEVPNSILHANPEIVVISIVSFLILFGIPNLKSKWMKKIPLPLLVVMVSIPMARFFDLQNEHYYQFLGNNYKVDSSFLVNLPSNLAEAIVFPDFGKMGESIFWIQVFTIAIIASLESLLSASAIDKIDPYFRTSNMNQELFAKGVANSVLGAIGGLPIIAEIVRSKANIDNGAVTRWSNFFHGMFLLLFVIFAKDYLHMIPLASLACILVAVGYRLSSPQEFYTIYRTGVYRLIVFIITIAFTLAFDLLIGIGVGLVAKMVLNFVFGTNINHTFIPWVESKETDSEFLVSVKSSLVFSNFLSLRKTILNSPSNKKLILDLRESKWIDPSSQEYLSSLFRDMKKAQKSFEFLSPPNQKLDLLFPSPT